MSGYWEQWVRSFEKSASKCFSSPPWPWVNMAHWTSEVVRSRDDSGCLWVMRCEFSEVWHQRSVFASWNPEEMQKSWDTQRWSWGVGRYDLCCQALALKTGGGRDCVGRMAQEQPGVIWFLLKEDRTTEDGPPFESNWKGKERQRTYSAFP